MNLKLVRHLSESLLTQLANHRSGVDVPFVLANGDIKAGQLIEPITLYLTFVVSLNMASPLVLPIDASNLQSNEVNVSTPEAAASPLTLDPANVVRSAVTASTFDPTTDHPPSALSTSVANPRADMPSAENALEIANEAMMALNLSDTWEGALGRIKWVMDTVSPVVEVRYRVFFAVLYLPK